MVNLFDFDIRLSFRTKSGLESHYKLGSWKLIRIKDNLECGKPVYVSKFLNIIDHVRVVSISLSMEIQNCIEDNTFGSVVILITFL